MFDETPAVGSFVDDILEDEEEEESNEEEEESNEEEDEELLQEDETPAGENPWLAAATDNVSHSKSRKEKEEEEEIDVNATMARLDVIAMFMNKQ